jgi:HPr kinase/phosphorylase
MKVGAIFEQTRAMLELERVPGTDGLERMVDGSDISSPGLALAGYVKRFVAKRLQVFGETEVTYLFSLDAETRCAHLAQFFSFPVPCVFVT